MDPTPQTEPPIVPDRVTVRTIGILNVWFSLCLLAGGLCVNFYALMIPTFSVMMEQVQKKAEQDEQARKTSLAKIDEAEKTATVEEKIALSKQRESLEDTQPNPAASLKAFADPRLRDMRIVTHFGLDLITGLFVNLLMLISGVGLLYYKGWARFLAVGVAWLKILRLLALSASAVLLLAPFVGVTLTTMETEALADDPVAIAEAPRDGAEAEFGVQCCAGLLLVLGSIYPIVTIRMLGRPQAKAAVRRVK